MAVMAENSAGGTTIGSAVAVSARGLVEALGEATRLLQHPLDELVRRVLSANDDPRRVVADIHARCFGAQLDDRWLILDDSPRLAATRFEDWLALH